MQRAGYALLVACFPQHLNSFVVGLESFSELVLLFVNSANASKHAAYEAEIWRARSQQSRYGFLVAFDRFVRFVLLFANEAYAVQCLWNALRVRHDSFFVCAQGVVKACQRLGKVAVLVVTQCVAKVVVAFFLKFFVLLIFQFNWSIKMIPKKEYFCLMPIIKRASRNLNSIIDGCKTLLATKLGLLG